LIQNCELYIIQNYIILKVEMVIWTSFLSITLVNYYRIIDNTVQCDSICRYLMPLLFSVSCDHL
jgi:hypothetical protein